MLKKILWYKRLLPIFVLIGLIPVLFFSYKISKNTYDSQLKNIQHYLQISNADKITSVKIFIQKFLDLSDMLGRESYFKTDISEAESLEMKMKFRNIIETFSGLNLLYFGAADGSFISYPQISLPADYDHRERLWYEKAVRNPGITIMTDPYEDIYNQQNIISVARAVYDNEGQLLGVIGIDFVMNELIKLVESDKNYETDYSFALLHDGMTVLHTQADKIGAYTFYKKILEQSTDISGFITYGEKSNTRIAYYEKIPELKWIFYTVISEKEALENARYVAGGMVLLAVFSIIGAFILELSFMFLVKKYTQNESMSAVNEELIAMNEEIEQSYNDIHDLSTKLEVLLEVITSTINRIGESEKDYFTYIFNRLFDIVTEADYGLLCLVRDDDICFMASRGHSIEKLQDVGYTASDLIETEDVMIVDPQSAYKFFDEEKARKSLEVIEPCKQRMIITIFTDKKAVGNFILDIAKDSTKAFSQDSVKAMKVFSATASSFLTYNRYTDLKGRMQKDIIMTMINILEVHDVYTKGHSNSVAEIAVKIARAMDMNRQDVLMVYWAGLVHDIGKILIPQAILNKPSKLTDIEYEEIKKHPEYGYIFLKKQGELKQIAEIVRYHHERFDGKGYPKGLKGEEIPLFSRIISVADAYDAIISLRPYRAPLSAEQAREEIFKNSGTQFDPKIVSVFFGLKL